MNEAKRYLSQLRSLEIRISRAEEEIERKRTKMTSIAIRYDKLNVQTSATEDPMAEYASALDELLRNIANMQRNYNRQREIIESQITELSKQNDRYASILALKYINNQTWQRIADRLHLTRETVIKYHGKALNMFAEMFGPFT